MLQKEGAWDVEGYADTEWKEMSSNTEKVASEVLGASKGLGTRPKDLWWWNEEV